MCSESTRMIKLILSFLCWTLLFQNLKCDNFDEESAKVFLQELNKNGAAARNKYELSHWAYESDINEVNRKKKLDGETEFAKFEKEVWKNATKYNWQTFKDESVRRQFRFISVLGTAALEEEDLLKLNTIVSKMQTIYSTAKICVKKDGKEECDLSLEPDLTERLAKSRDVDELKQIWLNWRDASGKQMKELYKEYVELKNKAAKLNNFTDTSGLWLMPYESDTFREDIEKLWKQLRPLYVNLHAYVRGRLIQKYGKDVMKPTGPIPAHLLGNMWAQTWGNIYEEVIPYPGKQSVDVTPEMNKQGFTPRRMFELAEDFFKSLNLSAMPPLFWSNSIIEKPVGRELVCHASAWDFFDGNDVRIKQCTRVNMDDLATVHHEMGHVQYFIQYKDQPVVFREGANPGFHEAVGDVMSLSVLTPKHLQQIGLMKEGPEDREATINYLMSVALEKIAFLPFGFLMDQWRWDVFQENVSTEDYNCHWWKLREEYQGIVPPETRSTNDFDPGAKYHIAAGVPYIRYFVSFVIQFQFHKALCIKANEYDPNNSSKPLHNCDIYKSTDAGNLLGKMLRLGSSRPWPEALEIVTGSEEMDASAIREYFMPLEDWLREENQRAGNTVGWDSFGTKSCDKDSASDINAASGINPSSLVILVATTIISIRFS